MPKNTRLPGHGLLSEGKPYDWDSEKRSWERAYGSKDGVALCLCGKVSQMLHSDAERKRWINIHKEQIREQVASQTEEDTPEASVFRCAECGDGTRLRAWTHVMAHGPVNAKGVIDDYDWTNDEDEVIEESVICQVHGEASIEKLVDGEYTATMIDGKFVSPTVALAAALLDDSGVKYDMEHRELYDLARRVGGRDHWRPAGPQDITRFGELAEARAQQRAANAKATKK